MKILSPRNNKDFYDYLTGVYGIDEKVVFDRRTYTALKNHDSPVFSKVRRPQDSKKEFKRYYYYDDLNNTWFERPTGEFYKCLLEAGNHWYVFRIERYLDDNGEVRLDWALLRKIVVDKNRHIGDAPMTFYENIKWDRFDSPEYIKSRLSKDSVAKLSNPILKDTVITSYIAADDIYQGIYAYISSLNDIEFADIRDDRQKIQSAGFDPVTSFRHPK